MELEAGAIVEGRVTRIMEFGAFVEFPNGESGLVHISQVAHEFVKNIRDHLNEGDVVSVLVLGRDEKGRLDLSIKELTPAPVEPPRPKRLPRQAPDFENKLKSFLRGSGGFGGGKKPGGKGGRKRR
ncbi:S1 RNA-binding domain-containing protein [Meiothermus ruber]|jgi:S1 RNA binding domain protein|uniref:RNA binding S1 domain protein n=2 Tax=Meiothermus ruber (strain ATCC 35948 / DSM 1279 / VKM B-1258 / 21) TaxID=504728 RepID=A0A806CKD1_MEIRD|nr:S1 RNA-binding domain-containing protein [Meiothermus ruber]ADD27043.1 RNA binding S1 domain protein [Meiothermus ruber DSM 1279]MCL6531458.1 S1 RNA-binding domain-containing protein [Meiothermus ruber]MCX7802826.1 S1 RNA-binding domain-containing protein [Meiothermus ruber]GAO73964.1 RNA binding S1 domain-containing protein [Meiothermus ruber H328]